MSVRLRIDRIVLDGYAFGPRERSRFEASLVAELTRLLSDDMRPAASFAVPAAFAPPIAVRGQEPVSLGAAVAQSVHAGVPR